MSSAGRTWFSSEDPCPRACTHYMGIRVPLAMLRHNARVLNDFSDTQDASARRQLLRMFLRINYRMMQNGKLGPGSMAFIEWDSADELSLPSYVALHVLYNPSDPSTECCGEGIGVLAGIAADDSKLLHKPKVDTEHLMLRTDMWAALASTYTGKIVVCDDFAAVSPADIFSTSRAGSLYDPATGTFVPPPHGNVVRMALTDLSPSVFFLKYCPWYQQRQLPDYPIVCKDDRATALLHVSRMVPNDQQDDLRSIWEQLKDRAARAVGRDDYVTWAREEITHSLCGQQAGYVPKPEQALATYHTRPLPVLPYSDNTLSPFAIWVSRFLMDCEAYAFLYKQHVLLLKLLMGTFDVCREARNGQLHYSAILAGPNSTSKSFVFTLIEDLLIPSTVSRATRRTENTFTYNRDQGSRVLIDHEMSGDFFGDAGARREPSARTAQTKEVLTSHEATTESCQMVDGQRVMTESTSRAHICYLAATNDWSVGQSNKGESSKDMALVSRFDVIFPTKSTAVEGKSILALMAADRNPTAAEKAGKQAMVEWVRTLQQANFWIHRSIFIGAMQDVNLDAVHAAVELYAAQRAISPRTIERILIMARQCCIVTALMVQYGFAESPRRGQQVLPQHLAELEPLLVATAEQAKFALGLYEAELSNRIHEPFSIALRKLSYRSDPDLGFNYLRVMGCDTDTQLVDELLMQMPTGHDVSRDLITAHMNKLREETLNSRPYRPSVSAPHGMAEDTSARPQQYYCMRGLSFHIKCVESRPEQCAPLEEILLKHCHVGPPGRELTAYCVDGHAHLLQTRDITATMKPFKQQGMFMPAVSAQLLGQHSSDTLQQEHRRSAEKQVEQPPELTAQQQRSAPDLSIFAAQCAAKVSQRPTRYPDAYVAAYAGQKRKR